MKLPNALHPPRYLARCDFKDVPHRFTDVLVLGSGLAGLRAALEIAPRFRVEVVTKGQSEQSNSRWAQGGIAAVWDPEDTFDAHAEDTLAAGKGLCNEKVVETVIGEAPTRVQELIEWGANFDKDGDRVALGLEGGHRRHRILHARGDATGAEVIRAAIARIGRSPNVRLRENTFTVDFLTDGERCAGVLAWHPQVGLQAIWAQQTILATGGCGQLFRETTNPPVATGDGIAAAYRAGAEVADMEFVQFHPTVLYVAGTARYLISEAVRGEGAYLRDANGERFMPACHPMAELAPRDAVSQAIVKRMEKTHHPCVYLDQSHLDADAVTKRFPSIAAACAQAGLDFARDRIPVRPGAHYMVGGVRTDIEGRSSLAGLWACGEVAATGLHGANRLASNSLLEAMVFGQRCGAGANALLETDAAMCVGIADASQNGVRDGGDRAPAATLDLDDIRNSLRSLMFRDVGIERTEAGLQRAKEQIRFWSQYVLPQRFDDPKGWELQNMLTTAGLIVEAALVREESRGTHFRADFPATDDARWRVHLATAVDRTVHERLPA